MQTSEPAANRKKILIIYFSFSSQTNNLILALTKGLEKYNIDIVRERLIPAEPLRFPVGSVSGTLLMMLETFVRRRIAIQPLSPACFDYYDLIMLAGPTWSYNPSGPVLALFDRDGRKIFNKRLVLPLISCRGYWRFHWWGLKRLLYSCGAVVVNLMVFSHPNPEPWRTLGVFLKLTGRVPERMPWFANRYRKYGHTRRQFKEARKFGEMIGRELELGGRKLHLLNFDTETALP